MKLCYILIVYLVVKRSIAFVINNNVSRKGKETKVNGFLDDWKLTFSEEGKKNRKAYNEGERAKQEEAQREIMERRNNPQKMAEYEQRVSAKRQKLQEDRQVWDFQTKAVDDPINDWNRLRKEGKIKVGSDLERDPSSSRLGSEGLVDVRIDDPINDWNRLRKEGKIKVGR